MIQTDLTQGYHHSPSNREIRGVVGSEVDINFYPSDYQNDTNFLNEAGIVTCMRSFATGYKVFGNRSAAFPTSSHVENFIHARRILDQIHEAIIFFTMQYVDRIGTVLNIEALEEGVNRYLRRKIGDGVLYGGTYVFDREKNTADEIADGRFHCKLEVHPISVMERITTHSYVDTKFINNALITGSGVVEAEPNAVWFDLYVAADVDTFQAQEIGLFDADGVLYALSRYDAPVPKFGPDSANLSDNTFRIVVVFSDTENVVVNVDPVAGLTAENLGQHLPWATDPQFADTNTLGRIAQVKQIWTLFADKTMLQNNLVYPEIETATNRLAITDNADGTLTIDAAQTWLWRGLFRYSSDDFDVAEHKRRFTKNISYFEPWHYVPLLARKPGALRDGAPFIEWQLPAAMNKIKARYMDTKGGDRDFVDLLILVQEHGIEVVEMACELAVEQKTTRLLRDHQPDQPACRTHD